MPVDSLALLVCLKSKVILLRKALNVLMNSSSSGVGVRPDSSFADVVGAGDVDGGQLSQLAGMRVEQVQEWCHFELR